MNDHPEHTLTERYRELLLDIAKTARQCGRNPEEIQLVVVSKYHPWNQLQPIYNEGQRVFGESKVQELIPKNLEAPSDTQWHFIGPLQKNKVRKVISQCTLIHSVDSLELATKISECSVEADVKAHILLQVNISEETSKQGMAPKDCLALCEKLLTLPNLSIDGLMTMAPLTDDTEVIRNCFRGLRNLQNELHRTYGANSFPHLSMGMSQDYRIAIEEGATILRVGSAIFYTSKQNKA
jgi:PLP dependent protein